jgi:hypothetical protein
MREGGVYIRAHGDVPVAAEDPPVRVRGVVQTDNEWVLGRTRDIFCCAVESSAGQFSIRIGTRYAHVVVKVHKRRIEVRHRLAIRRVVQFWDDVRESRVLHSTECVPDSEHFRFDAVLIQGGKLLTRKKPGQSSQSA